MEGDKFSKGNSWLEALQRWGNRHEVARVESWLRQWLKGEKLTEKV
jgi:hypothetical protein